MRAFVTGATGFVGPHLVAHLTSCDDEVIAADDERGTFDIVDRDLVHATIAQSQPEVIYHLAARSEVGASWKDPNGVMRVNVDGTRNVLDAARACGVRRVLVVGSAEEYGPVEAGHAIREDAALHPATPYGESKVAASVLALDAWVAHGLETIRTRTFSHTGPGQTDRFLVPALARRIVEAERRGDDHIVTGSLEPVRDMSDVRDVVRAYRLLITHGKPGEVYNVCRGVGVSVGELARRLVERARVPLRIEIDPALVRPVDVARLVGDPERLRRTTGWEPRYNLDDTLDAVLTDARARFT
jgi:GDP-4-dehydro-6-deoxy-D-mannose reductase